MLFLARTFEMLCCCQEKEDEALIRVVAAKEAPVEVFPALTNRAPDSSEFMFKQKMDQLDNIVFKPSGADFDFMGKMGPTNQLQKEAQAPQEVHTKNKVETGEEAVQEQLPPEPKPCVKQVPQEPPEPKVQVTLEFASCDGTSATLRLVRRPIGLTFDLLRPQLTVKSVVPLSPGEDVGVKSNMTLTRIDGEPLADKTSDQAWQIVKVAVGKLPVKTSYVDPS